jgi:hypothetical protein
MSEANTRKICYEELFDKFKNAASTWLKDIPEARGLCLVVDWKVGRTEFPPSLLITLDPPCRAIAGEHSPRSRRG